MSIFKFRTIKLIFKPSFITRTLFEDKYNFNYFNWIVLKGTCYRNCSHSGYPETFQNLELLNSSQRLIEKVPLEVQINKNGQFTLEGHSLSYLSQSELCNLKENLNIQKLQESCIENYDVKVGMDKHTLCFPMQDDNHNTIAVQFLMYNQISGKLEQEIFPKETCNAVFGWPAVPDSQEDIIITSHCLDAIAARQETGIASVAVHFNNGVFPSQVLNYFERFSKIYLWFSEKYHHWALHKLFVEKFGKRTFLIRTKHNPSTPLSCLQNGHNFKHILSGAIPLKHDSIETFSTFKDETFSEFVDYEKYSGAKWKRFPVLNELLKGLRKSELTIFSGQTGTGKTTFMSEYSLDLCMQGLPTLWGSFEVTNTRLLKTMLTQFSLCSLRETPEKFRYWASEFDKLPMFFMNFNGHHTMKAILEAMSHTVAVYTIEHIIIDNLQFMMNTENYDSAVDQIRRQDQVFALFRNFACQHSCHVTLVMHPRKVTKNRFDGEKGCVILEFNKNTLTFEIKKIGNRPKKADT